MRINSGHEGVQTAEGSWGSTRMSPNPVEVSLAMRSNHRGPVETPRRRSCALYSVTARTQYGVTEGSLLFGL